MSIHLKSCCFTLAPNVWNLFGFGVAWEMQGVGDVKLFLKELKQRLTDCFRQDWHSVLGPYVRRGDNYFIQRIPSILEITVKYWYAGSGNSPIQATLSGVNLFPFLLGIALCP